MTSTDSAATVAAAAAATEEPSPSPASSPSAAAAPTPTPTPTPAVAKATKQAKPASASSSKGKGKGKGGAAVGGKGGGDDADGGIDPFLLGALSSNLENRTLILNLDKELENFLEDKSRDRLWFPEMNSYQRRITHRVAEYFKLRHPVQANQNDVKVIVLYKTAESCVPVLRFSDLCAAEPESTLPTAKAVAVATKKQQQKEREKATTPAANVKLLVKKGGAAAADANAAAAGSAASSPADDGSDADAKPRSILRRERPTSSPSAESPTASSPSASTGGGEKAKAAGSSGDGSASGTTGGGGGGGGGKGVVNLDAEAMAALENRQQEYERARKAIFGDTPQQAKKTDSNATNDAAKSTDAKKDATPAAVTSPKPTTDLIDADASTKSISPTSPADNDATSTDAPAKGDVSASSETATKAEAASTATPGAASKKKKKKKKKKGANQQNKAPGTAKDSTPESSSSADGPTATNAVKAKVLKTTSSKRSSSSMKHVKFATAQWKPKKPPGAAAAATEGSANADPDAEHRAKQKSEKEAQKQAAVSAHLAKLRGGKDNPAGGVGKGGSASSVDKSEYDRTRWQPRQKGGRGGRGGASGRGALHSATNPMYNTSHTHAAPHPHAHLQHGAPTRARPPAFSSYSLPGPAAPGKASGAVPSNAVPNSSAAAPGMPGNPVRPGGTAAGIGASRAGPLPPGATAPMHLFPTVVPHGGHQMPPNAALYPPNAAAGNPLVGAMGSGGPIAPGAGAGAAFSPYHQQIASQQQQRRGGGGAAFHQQRGGGRGRGGRGRGNRGRGGRHGRGGGPRSYGSVGGGTGSILDDVVPPPGVARGSGGKGRASKARGSNKKGGDAKKQQQQAAGATDSSTSNSGSAATTNATATGAEKPSSIAAPNPAAAAAAAKKKQPPHVPESPTTLRAKTEAWKPKHAGAKKPAKKAAVVGGAPRIPNQLAAAGGAGKGGKSSQQQRFEGHPKHHQHMHRQKESARHAHTQGAGQRRGGSHNHRQPAHMQQQHQHQRMVHGGAAAGDPKHMDQATLNRMLQQQQQQQTSSVSSRHMFGAGGAGSFLQPLGPPPSGATQGQQQHQQPHNPFAPQLSPFGRPPPQHASFNPYGIPGQSSLQGMSYEDSFQNLSLQGHPQFGHPAPFQPAHPGSQGAPMPQQGQRVDNQGFPIQDASAQAQASSTWGVQMDTSAQNFPQQPMQGSGAGTQMSYAQNSDPQQQQQQQQSFVSPVFTQQQHLYPRNTQSGLRTPDDPASGSFPMQQFGGQPYPDQAQQAHGGLPQQSAIGGYGQQKGAALPRDNSQGQQQQQQALPAAPENGHQYGSISTQSSTINANAQVSIGDNSAVLGGAAWGTQASQAAAGLYSNENFGQGGVGALSMGAAEYTPTYTMRAPGGEHAQYQQQFGGVANPAENQAAPQQQQQQQPQFLQPLAPPASSRQQPIGGGLHQGGPSPTPLQQPPRDSESQPAPAAAVGGGQPNASGTMIQSQAQDGSGAPYFEAVATGTASGGQFAMQFASIQAQPPAQQQQQPAPLPTDSGVVGGGLDAMEYRRPTQLYTGSNVRPPPSSTELFDPKKPRSSSQQQQQQQQAAAGGAAATGTAGKATGAASGQQQQQNFLRPLNGPAAGTAASAASGDLMFKYSADRTSYLPPTQPSSKPPAHILEISSLPPGIGRLEAESVGLFDLVKAAGADQIKWLSDTMVIGIFPNPRSAQQALDTVKSPRFILRRWSGRTS